jgi:hypothetical protein
MTGSTEYEHSFPNINMNTSSVLEMLQKLSSFKMEERDLALDRFKRINDYVSDDEEKFFVYGKNAILYLDSASKSSNVLMDMAKDIMKTVNDKTGEESSNITGSLDIHMKNMINQMVEQKDGRPITGSSDNVDGNDDLPEGLEESNDE